MGYETITNLALGFTDGAENPSGISEEAYFIPLSFLETVAKPVPATTSESYVEITTSHIMKTGMAPIPIVPHYKKSGAKAALAGEELSKIFQQTTEFFMPQITAGNIGSASALKNYRGIVLIRRAGNETEFIQIGSKSLPATIIGAEADLGTGPTGAVGIKFTLEAFSVFAFYIYKGVVPIEGV